MFDFFRFKKRNIAIFLLLIFNQFLLKGYSINNKKLYKGELNKKTFHKNYKNKNNNTIQEFIVGNSYMQELLVQKEVFISELEQTQIKVKDNNVITNLDKPKNKSIYENLKNKYITGIDKGEKSESIDYKKIIDMDKLENESIDGDLNNDYLDYTTNADKKNNIKFQENKEENRNKLPLPSKSEIFTSEFKVPSRGYVKLNGPPISLNLQRADSFEILKLIGQLGNYGIVLIEDIDSQKEESKNNAKITATFDKADISDVFNSILLSSNMQAIVENNIIFVGKNILNKSLNSKVSKTFRLNQVNAASVADYLSTLGARISKVMLLTGSINGQEIGDSLVNKKDFDDELVNPYGMVGGPLFGLIGTADLRLQTLTLIGSKDLMKSAEKYIKSLDIRHRQVALTIKMIDVSLTKADIKNNIFEFKKGETEILNNSGLGIKTANFAYGAGQNATVPNIFTEGLVSGQFFNWLEAKITNENAKILASPTLILGENPNVLPSGAASVDDTLSAATIGRPFKNEGFIKVGETVITSFTQTKNEGGSTTCTGTEGTAGITFGAKLEKIDDNGYVTFALSPAISSITKSIEITGCGIQNTLSVRKLDTGSIRVKNGETLILTGVLQDSDSVSVSKVPILGDIPILGSLFRDSTTQKRKSELIILVTPRILKDE